MSMYNDGRRQSQRAVRKDGYCTVCGKRLPDSFRDWGLVWDSRKCGICVECMNRIRTEIGKEPIYVET